MWENERVNELGRRRMRPLPPDLYPFPEHWDQDRVLRHGLTEILLNQRMIMADLSKLKAADEQLSVKLDALLADTTSQSDIDAIQESLDAKSAKIDAVLPPA